MKFLKGPMAFIAISMFLNFLGFTIIIPVIPFLIEKYVDPSSLGLYVGLIMSAYAFCQFFAAPVLGALSDRFGRRPILLLSLFGSVIGYIVFGLGGALWVLFLGRIIDGLTGGNISTMFAYVADIAKPQERGKFYGILGAAGGFGFMLGPVIGGIAATFSLTMPLYVAAAVTFANMCWGYFVLPESLAKESRTPTFEWKHLNPFAPFSHIFTSMTLRILFTASFLFYFAGTAFQSNISVFLKQILHFGPTDIGIILFVVGVMDIFTQGFLTAKLLPRFGEKNLAFVGLLVNAIGFVMIAMVAFFPSVALIYTAIIIFNLGDGLFQPSLNSLISNAAVPGTQGRVQGASQGMQSVARVLGPLLGAWLFLYGESVPYFSGACLILLGLVILFTFRKKVVAHSVAHV